MQRACFTFQIRPGTEREYQRRHDEIWPELIAALKESGFANYTLFRRGTTVIGYVECHPDRDTAFAAIAETEVDSRWQRWFGDVLAPGGADGGPAHWAEVWHLD